MTEDKFRAMVQRHDFTYEYSDDARSYKRGRDSYAAILLAAKELPRERAVAIWNEAVDEHIGPEVRSLFRWTE